MSERCDEIRVTAVQTGPANLQRLRSQRAVKALAAEEPCVLLPGHDPDVPRRLEGRICMRANGDAATHASEPRKTAAQA